MMGLPGTCVGKGSITSGPQPLFPGARGDGEGQPALLLDGEFTGKLYLSSRSLDWLP